MNQAPPLLTIPEDHDQWNNLKTKLVAGGVYQVQTRDGQRKYCLWNGTTLVPCKFILLLYICYIIIKKKSFFQIKSRCATPLQDPVWMGTKKQGFFSNHFLFCTSNKICFEEKREN